MLTPGARVCLTTRGDGLEDARARLDAFLDEHAVASRPRFVAHLVLEECLTNLEKYVLPRQAALTLDASIEAEDVELVFRLSDDGPAFDPTSTPDAAPAADIEEARIGGLGLMLVRRMANSVAYERRDDTNCLTVRLGR